MILISVIRGKARNCPGPVGSDKSGKSQKAQILGGVACPMAFLFFIYLFCAAFLPFKLELDKWTENLEQNVKEVLGQ